MRKIKILRLLMAAGIVLEASATESPSTRTLSALQSLNRQHMIVVDEDGDLLDPDLSSFLTARKADSAEESALIRLVIDSALSSVHNKITNRIVFFIHGGLNTWGGSSKRVKKLNDSMMNEKVYPIWIIWKTGPVSTYTDHLWSIRQGREAPVLGPISFPVVLATDFMTALVRAPLIIGHNIATDVKTWPILPNIDKNEDAIFNEFVRQKQQGLKTFDLERRVDSRTGMDIAFRGITYIATIPSKVVFGPFITALGQPAWNIMLRRTTTVFRKSGEFNVKGIRNDTSKLRVHSQSPSTGALSKALNYLNANIDSTKHLRIDLIGHSMGTIIANHILVQYPQIHFSNIVYMAAACQVQELENAVIPYISQPAHETTHFYNLTLHPIAERRERGPLDLWQRGSLLEWIDNFLASPNNTQERTLGKWENILQCLHIVPESIRDRITIKSFGVGRLPHKEPQVHGAFSRFNFWDENFWKTSENKKPHSIRYID